MTVLLADPNLALDHFVQAVDARNVEKLLGSLHRYDTAGKAAIARVRRMRIPPKLPNTSAVNFFTQICLGILSKWEGEPSSSISRLSTEAKNLLANCELELEARDANHAMLFHVTL